MNEPEINIDIITDEMKALISTLIHRVSIIKPKGYKLVEYVDNAKNQTFSFHCYKIDTGELVREASNDYNPSDG
jgi:hypothetical protein